MIRLIELFGGIGAQAKALENLEIEFEHYKYCEFDEMAVKSYNLIHNTNFKSSDINNLKGSDLEITDLDKHLYIMCYTFPCTDLSVVGLKNGFERESGTRSSLLWQVERLLNECEQLPQILFMENVKLILGKKNKDNFDLWCKFLETKGYTNYYKIINAKDCGVPQNRERCIMVSIREKKRTFTFPHQIPLLKTMFNYTDNKVDDKYCIENDIRKLTLLTDILNGFNGKTVVVGGLGEKKSNNGTQWYMQDRIYRANIANTICTVCNPYYYFPNGDIRKLTPLENWRLMGFDDKDYYNATKSGISERQLIKQAGNSIVVKVVESIFKELLK